MLFKNYGKQMKLERLLYLTITLLGVNLKDYCRLLYIDCFIRMFDGSRFWILYRIFKNVVKHSKNWYLLSKKVDLQEIFFQGRKWSWARLGVCKSGWLFLLDSSILLMVRTSVHCIRLNNTAALLMVWIICVFGSRLWLRLPLDYTFWRGDLFSRN